MSSVALLRLLPEVLEVGVDAFLGRVSEEFSAFHAHELVLRLGHLGANLLKIALGLAHWLLHVVEPALEVGRFFGNLIDSGPVHWERLSALNADDEKWHCLPERLNALAATGALDVVVQSRRPYCERDARFESVLVIHELMLERRTSSVLITLPGCWVTA